jgi:outer membrane protein assembly factor BamB
VKTRSRYRRASAPRRACWARSRPGAAEPHRLSAGATRKLAPGAAQGIKCRRPLAGVTLATALFNAACWGADWTAWRGPAHRGATTEKAVVTSWSEEGDNLLWRSEIGGRTTPIVLDGRVYFLTPAGEGVSLRERAVCLDADTGKLLWEHSLNVFHTDIVENRVGWTAMAADPETHRVYAHATGGELLCFTRDGEVVWKHSLTEEFGRVSGYGGRLYTPIVDGPRLIIGLISSSWGDHAKAAQRFVAFDKRDGSVLWSVAPGEPPTDTTYATPAVAMLGGRRTLVAPGVDGWVYGLAASSGQTLWKYKFSARPLNTSPVVDGERVFVTHSEENPHTTAMGAVACIDGARRGEVDAGGVNWRVDGVCEAGYCSPAIANGRLYVVDNSANLFCYDAASGKEAWRFKLGRVGKGSPVVTADGVIYVGEQNGVFWILRDAGERCEVLDKHEFPARNDAIDELFGSPAVCGGRVYFMTRYGSFALGKRGATVQTADFEPEPAEVVRLDDPPAALRIMPAEVTLAPGESVRFDALPVTAHGHPTNGLSPGPQWSTATLTGSISADGTFSAGRDAGFSAGTVTVKVGNLTAAARVRIAPTPPFVEDFERYELNDTPPGWLGVIGKTKVTERDGSKVLVHLAERPHPAFMRIRTFMTPPVPGGYTIQADMLGALKKTAAMEFRPDMGLVNTRYDMLLLGMESALRITSWAPMPRIQKDVPFDWQPDTWYRMKFEVRLEPERARLRGKVWPREQPEPAAWSIELDDPCPNREGSPALYGYANGTTAKSKGAEIYYDNVQCSPTPTDP